MSGFTSSARATSETRVGTAERGVGLVHFPAANELQARRLNFNDDREFGRAIETFYHQFCSLRSEDGGQIRTLGVTSCYANEGKSAVAASFAAIAAESQRVALIAASEPRSTIHKEMKEFIFRAASSETGGGPFGPKGQLSETNPWGIPSNNGQAGVAETGDLVRSLLSEFDLIVVDLPPLNSPSSLEWVPILNGTVLLLESERVRWQVAAKSIELLEQIGGHVVGTIINKQRKYIPGWLYRRF
jgi:Mrp family chromosome partitioning ATPase